jgi:peroxiredoxin
MQALTVGTSAPDFSLSAMDGKSFNLRDALARGPVVLIFFKVSCPTCQYTLPFYERLYKAYGDKQVTLAGISQNDRKDTAAFCREFQITFPVLLDPTNNYPVSNAHGLTNVPTIFWIEQDGSIEISSAGWVKKEFDDINRRWAEAGQNAPAQVFRAGDDVRDFRAG